MVTMAEAAGLSGLAPDRIRELIDDGRLAADWVRLPVGSTYLIRMRQLEPFRSARAPGVAQSVAMAPPAPPASPDLEAALAGLQAALARRRTYPRALSETDELPDERPTPTARPPRRPIGGLSAAELQALAAGIDRLLTPITPLRLAGEAS